MNLPRHTETGIRLCKTGNVTPSAVHFSHNASVDRSNARELAWSFFSKTLLCDWSDWESIRVDLRHILLDEAGQITSDLPPMCYFDVANDEKEFFHISHRLAKDHISDSCGQSSPSKRGRIGVLSLDFLTHSGGLRFLNLFDELKKNFEIYIYQAYFDAIQPLVPECFANIKHISLLEPDRAAKVVANDELDILIDTTRHIAGDCTTISGSILGPIKISAFGFGGSTGSRNFDYFATSNLLTPMDDDAYFSEKLLYIDQYHPLDFSSYVPIVRTETADRIVIACFSAHYKLTPEYFQNVVQLVNTFGNVEIWMIAGGESQKNLQKEINAAGVGDRIYFIPRMSYFDHIARIKHVDICLDVPNLGGSASLVDCLMSGAIPVTYEGKQFASRFGSSLLTDIGLGELCANSFEAYWGLICRLISDSQWRTFMREKINALLVQRHKFELSSQAASWKSILEKVISQ